MAANSVSPPGSSTPTGPSLNRSHTQHTQHIQSDSGSTRRPRPRLPRSVGGPAIVLDPTDRLSLHRNHREVWGLGAILPAGVRKRIAQEQGSGSVEGDDAYSERSLSRQPRTPSSVARLDEIDQDPFSQNSFLREELGKEITGQPLVHSPGPVIHEDKALELPAVTPGVANSHVETEKRPSGGSARTRRDSVRSRQDSVKSRRGSVGTQDQGQVGGELAEYTQDWDAMQSEMEDRVQRHVRNSWGRVRFVIREPLAEFLGMLVLIILGVGSDCQVRMSATAAGTFSDQNWTWGFGVMSAIYIAGGVSGGHMNPAITICLAIFRGFPWRMVPRYIIAQTLGAFVAAFVIYGNYTKAIHQYDPLKLIHPIESNGNASASLFVTVPNESVGGTLQGFGQEIIATGILAIVVLALGDENNAPPGAGLGALVLGLVVTAIGMSNGWTTGYAINPARDFGPRLALWVLGYGEALWTHNHAWWLVGPILGTTVGGIVGAFLYDLCIYVGEGSPVNYSKSELKTAITLPPLHSMVPQSFRSATSDAAEQANNLASAESGYAGLRKMKRGEGAKAAQEKDTGWRWKMTKLGNRQREQTHPEAEAEETQP